LRERSGDQPWPGGDVESVFAERLTPARLAAWRGCPRRAGRRRTVRGVRRDRTYGSPGQAMKGWLGWLIRRRGVAG